VGSRGDSWILNTLIGTAGFDVLHPGMKYEHAKLGYGASDFDRVFSRVKRGEMLVKAWVTVGTDLERRARWAEREGFLFSAGALFGRAALLYGRGAYSVLRDTPIKAAYHAKLVSCHSRMVELHGLSAERVEIPFEGKTIYGVLHRPRADGGDLAPALVLLPGMDMFKEEWTRLAQQSIVPRGIAVLSIDGPGQGESLLHGLKVGVTNYDAAGEAVVDFLSHQPGIDSERIGLAGFSFGAYWAARLGAVEKRLKCVACIEGVDKDVLFREAQPNYRTNFMYMAGIEDEEEFETLIDQLVLDELAPHIECPTLFVQGEFDELRSVEEALRVYDLVPPPKEIWILEDQFHPMGEWADELPLFVVDWFAARLEDRQHYAVDRRLFLRQDGSIVEGDGRLPWWDPCELA
jgi:pimeloyl-ACP methyl ester carboxylesterase